jgi:hypothetical protein
VPLSTDAVEVCRVYLEQNALILQAFGHLRQARWLADQAYACRDRAHGGCTRGVYAFAVIGTQAEGQVNMVWVREPGREGCPEVAAVQVIEHRVLQGVPPSRTPVRASEAEQPERPSTRAGAMTRLAQAQPWPYRRTEAKQSAGSGGDQTRLTLDSTMAAEVRSPSRR